MLRQRTLIQHKRKNSQLQLFHPLSSTLEYNHNFEILEHNNNKKKINHITNENKPKPKSSQTQKLKISSSKSKQNKSSSINTSNKINSKHILQLVQNSSKIRDKKLTVIQNIDHHHHNCVNDQNCDYGNGGMCKYEENSQQLSDQQNNSFFQFGRKSRSSYYKQQQKPSPSTIDNTQQLLSKNLNYELNMEQIIQVPDTMSNSRRYDNSNGKFYQFTTLMMDKQNTQTKHSASNQPQLSNSEKNQNQHRLLQTIKNTQQQKKQLFGQNNNINLVKKQQTTKNLHKRKEKQPKLNNIINKESIEKDKLMMDFSTISYDGSKKKSKLHLLANNKKDEKLASSKSKQFSKFGLHDHNKEVEKMNMTQLMGRAKKQKNIESHRSLIKKKSLSLKDKNNKSVLKLSSQKQKSTKSINNNSRSLQNKSQASLSIKKTTNSNTNKQLLFQQNNDTKTKMSINQKIQLIQQSQSKLQSQYKILFQCVGQLWQNNRIARYISQKNKSDILKLQQEESQQQSKLIKLKSQIMSAISSARY